MEDSSWYLYKSDLGEELFYYNSQTGEHRFPKDSVASLKFSYNGCSTKNSTDEQEMHQTMNKKPFLASLLSPGNDVCEDYNSHQSCHEIHGAANYQGLNSIRAEKSDGCFSSKSLEASRCFQVSVKREDAASDHVVPHNTITCQTKPGGEVTLTNKHLSFHTDPFVKMEMTESCLVEDDAREHEVPQDAITHKQNNTVSSYLCKQQENSIFLQANSSFATESLVSVSDQQPSLLDDLFALDYCLSPAAVHCEDTQVKETSFNPLHYKETKGVLSQVEVQETVSSRNVSASFIKVSHEKEIQMIQEKELQTALRYCTKDTTTRNNPPDFEPQCCTSQSDSVVDIKTKCMESNTSEESSGELEDDVTKDPTFSIANLLPCEMESPDGEKNTYGCSECGEMFPRKRNLQRHVLRIHDHSPDRETNAWSSDKEENIFHDCSECGKTFTRKRNLQRHVVRVHVREKKHRCEYCGKAFVERSCLIKHIRMHTGQRPYPCTICGHAFTQPQNLNKHIRTCHMKDTIKKEILKPHKCEICEKCFSDRAHLDRHNMIHTGVKPYKCTVCSIAYRELHHLTRHLKCKRHKRKEAAIHSRTSDVQENPGPEKFQDSETTNSPDKECQDSETTNSPDKECQDSKIANSPNKEWQSSETTNSPDKECQDSETEIISHQHSARVEPDTLTPKILISH